MTSQTLHIPNWHPASVNKLLTMHHMKAHRLKNADKQMVAAYASKQGIIKASGKRQLEVIITLGKGQRACDPDNYSKSLLDALKTARLIKDDNRQWLEYLPMKFNRKQYSATTIKLTDIEELPPGYAENSIQTQYVKPKKTGHQGDA